MYPALVVCLVLAEEAVTHARELVKSDFADWVDVHAAGKSWVGWLGADVVDGERALMMIFTDDHRVGQVAEYLEAVPTLATMQLGLMADMGLDVHAHGIEV